MNLHKYLSSKNIDLSTKQIECLILVFDRIVKQFPDIINSNYILDDVLMKKAKIFAINLPEEFWDYLIGQTCELPLPLGRGF